MRGAKAVRIVAACALVAGAAFSPAAAEEANRVGSETCAGCHADLAKSFEGTVHAKADPKEACEGCHGPGSRHVEEGNTALIRRFAPEVPPAERSAACITCHEKDRERLQWHSADHALAAVACDDCHDPHQARRARNLLRTATPFLCYGCHGEVRAQFALTERHPVDDGTRKGSIDCVDCHNPHAPTDRRSLGGFKQNACLKCHSEYRGPYVFEHEAVAVEGCLACHAPHGSVNRHLLTYQRAGDLCLQCHPEQPFFHVLVDQSGHRTTGFNDCTRCHTEIHGSNNDALFLN